MNFLPRFFLAVLLLTFTAVSWAACPEGQKQTYKGCEAIQACPEGTKQTTKGCEEIKLPSYVEIEIPTYVDKAKASPWNFFDDFEGGQLTGYGLTIHTMKSHPESVLTNIFEFKKEENGNTYLAITARHGVNYNGGRNCTRTGMPWPRKYRCKTMKAERSEMYPERRDAREKIVWYGFRMKIPDDFVPINDRVLLTQFKHFFEDWTHQSGLSGASPLVGIRLYEKGSRVNIGGQHGGDLKIKNRSNDYKQRYFSYLAYQKRSGETWYANPRYAYNGRSSSAFKLKQGVWVTYKIGVYVTTARDGFVEIYQDGELIYDYTGLTFGFVEGFENHAPKIGVYRDSDPTGQGYPDQTVHYDDFAVVSDKKTLDKLIPEE